MVWWCSEGVCHHKRCVFWSRNWCDSWSAMVRHRAPSKLATVCNGLERAIQDIEFQLWKSLLSFFGGCRTYIPRSPAGAVIRLTLHLVEMKASWLSTVRADISQNLRSPCPRRCHDPMPVFFDVFTFFTPFFSHCLGTKRVILQDPSGPVPSNCWLALRYFAPRWCPDRTVASMGKQTASQWYDPLRIESLMRGYLPFLKKRAFSKPFWGGRGRV